MSYELLPDRRYRMPTHFGPAPGPRQRLDGSAHTGLTDRPSETTASVTWAVHPDRIAPHLPAGFSPADDGEVTVQFRMLRDIPWLAGRGYNIASVLLSAVWTDSREAGRFLAVLWESMADPIITGRDELGYPKLYADVSDLAWRRDERTATATASWDGFTFLELELKDLPSSDPCIPRRSDEPVFVYKYVPATGSRGADACYPVMTPGASGNRLPLETHRGSGSFTFHPATWEQLPTFVHVVNSLAELQPDQLIAAELVLSRGASDLGGQVALSQDMNRG
jgi:hypothetical protein